MREGEETKQIKVLYYLINNNDDQINYIKVSFVMKDFILEI